MSAGHVLGRLCQIDKLVRQLRRPDHVGLVNVDISVTGCQPKAILAELLAARRRHRDDIDLVAGIFLELDDLLLQKLDVVARRIGGDGNLHRMGAHRRQTKRHARCEHTLKNLHSSLLPSIL